MSSPVAGMRGVVVAPQGAPGKRPLALFLHGRHATCYTDAETDSIEWHVCLFATGKLYADAVQGSLPAPWRLPTREEAQILKTLTYPHDERFVTSDGYTFAMPSATVSKAGAKTKYSVLGLWIRTTVIRIDF